MSELLSRSLTASDPGKCVHFTEGDHLGQGHKELHTFLLYHLMSTSPPKYSPLESMMPAQPNESLMGSARYVKKWLAGRCCWVSCCFPSLRADPTTTYIPLINYQYTPFDVYKSYSDNRWPPSVCQMTPLGPGLSSAKNGIGSIGPTFPRHC